MKRTDEEKKQRAKNIVLHALKKYGNLKVCDAISGCNFYDVAGNLFHVSVELVNDAYLTKGGTDGE